MGKRFIDTEIFLRPWYRSLPPRLKCLWFYLLSRCDMAGVIDADWDLISFSIGEKVQLSDLEDMKNNVLVLPSGKLFLPKFIEFQYGKKLSLKSKVHEGVMKTLSLHEIEYPL